MSSTRRFRRSVRSVALVATGSLALGVLPALPASADHGTPFDLQAACQFAPDHDFNDSDVDRLEVVKDCLQNWVDDNGTAILQGSGGNANFDGNISRAQFSAVLVRVAGILGATIPTIADDQEPTFPDVPRSNIFFGNIEQAAAMGLFLGTNDEDVNDLDNDGDTEEVLFNPSGDISFAQVIGTIRRLLGDTLDQDLPDDEAGNESGLDCGVFNGDLEVLEGRSIFDEDTNTLPDDCTAAALRGQIFDLIAVVMTYEVASGVIDAPYGPDTNAALTITPGDADTLEFGDIRQFTVTGADDDSEYRIAILEEDDVTNDDGIFSFLDDDEDEEADLNVESDITITVVNGSATGNSGGETEDVSPVDGKITFTINSSDLVTGWPVVFNVDEDNDLEVDEDAEPLSTEEFGVGGATSFIPTEADINENTGGYVLLLSGDDSFAVHDSDFYCCASEETVYFTSGDTFRSYDDDSGNYPIISETEFFRVLSVGDQIWACSNVQGDDGLYMEDDGPTTWCHFNEEPSEPNVTLSQGTPADVELLLTWTGTEYDSFNLYINELGDGESCSDIEDGDEDLEANVAPDDVYNEDEGWWEYTFEGLTPDTEYCVGASSVSGEEESTIDDDDLFTSEEIEAPIVTSATLENDEVLEGEADAGDIWEFVFSEEMDASTVSGAVLSFTDKDGDTIKVFCDGSVDFDGDGDVNTTDATCEFDVVDIDTLTVTLLEDAVDRNAAGDGDIDYGLTLTAITLLMDADDGSLVDIAGSTDVLVS